ncbi:MAG: DUF3579 domain-containing protein [Nitrosospira sp.]
MGGSEIPISLIEFQIEVAKARVRAALWLRKMLSIHDVRDVAIPAAEAPSPSPRLLAAPAVDELLIKGMRRDGSIFRPSDWAERLCGVANILHSDAAVLSRTHHNARPNFLHSDHARPAIVCGVLCVIVGLCLYDLEPRVWEFVTTFARDNDLVTRKVLSSYREDEF